MPDSFWVSSFEENFLDKNSWISDNKIFSYSKLVRTQHNTTHNGDWGKILLEEKKDCYEVSEKEILSPVVEFPTWYN